VKDTLERDRYLDDDELSRLLKVARSSGKHGRRDHCLLSLLANTGLRPSEALSLTVGDLDLNDHEPSLRVRRLKKRKPRAPDQVPLSRVMGRTLRGYVRSSWAADSRVFPMRLRNLQKLFHRHAHAAGLEVPLYALRHTAGTRAWRATRDLRLVQDMLGHASPITTQIYTHVDPAARRNAAERAGSAT